MNLAAFLAVNPVPWARSQMAFTLAFHIILVPLGVSWAFMTLIANYRASSTTMTARCSWRSAGRSTWPSRSRSARSTGTGPDVRVRSAVAEVHGRVGRGVRRPVRVRGLFFFTEAIFVAIYIYGWRRLKPWAALLDRRTDRDRRHRRRVSVVAANAWMNDPRASR
jgi:cytochrome d ubiquinol oxidase subunit I